MKIYTWDLVAKKSIIVIKTKFLQFGVIVTRFADFNGTTIADQTFRYPEVNLHIHAASLLTQNPEQDEKLKSAAYYFVEKYPDIIFQSIRGCKQSGGGVPELTGNLSIKGVTKPITLVTTFMKIDPPGRRPKAVFHLYGHANYSDWQIGSADSSGIGDDMLFLIELQFIKIKLHKAASKSWS